jgi:hypothetical protein
MAVLLAHHRRPDDFLDGLLVADVLDLVARQRLLKSIL